MKMLLEIFFPTLFVYYYGFTCTFYHVC